MKDLEDRMAALLAEAYRRGQIEAATVRPAINEAEPSPEQQTQWPVQSDIMDALMKSDGLSAQELHYQIASDTGRWYQPETIKSALSEMHESGLVRLVKGDWRELWWITGLGREKAS